MLRFSDDGEIFHNGPSFNNQQAIYNWNVGIMGITQSMGLKSVNFNSLKTFLASFPSYSKIVLKNIVSLGSRYLDGGRKDF